MADSGQDVRNLGDSPGRRLTRHGPLIALAILLAGIALSAVVAGAWSARQRRDQRQAFAVASENVSATLSTLVRADANFVATMRAVLTIEPHLSPSGFDDWYQRLQGEKLQTGGVGMVVTVKVPYRSLSRFEARRDSDPAFRELLGSLLEPVIPSGRHTYCLLAAGRILVRLDPLLAYLMQTDWCQPTSPVGFFEGPLLREATDAGQTVIEPIDKFLKRTFFETAFYRRGVPLQTVAQRRAAVAGWMLSSFDMSAQVQQAIGPNRGFGVALSFTEPNGGSVPVAAAGRAMPGLSHTSDVLADGRWTIRVQGPATVHGLIAAQAGWLLFAAGVVISVLLALLVFTLARSRESALELVATKTAELRHQAMHDALTGLPNRLLALNRAEQMLARGRRSGFPVALLYIDLDDFKHINDTYGHGVGDRLLQIVAERLRAVVREAETAARLSGDEFIVLVEGSTPDAGPELVAERVISVLREPYDLSEQIGSLLTIGVSIGIANIPRDAAEQLLADADVALYCAKKAGKNNYVLFESGMHATARERIALESGLAGALEAGELSLVYQPVFDLLSERVFGAEARLRWNNAARGEVAPEVFIPIAESSGLIVAIGRWVLQTACRDAAAWHAQGHMLSVAVKISGRQLEHKLLLADVRRALQLAKLEPAWLTLEITETSLMRDPDAAAHRLAVLKQLGVRIAVDDFGTGYSSLAQLPRLPVDILKIHRSFVQSLNTSSESLTVIRTLIELGRSLHLQTLAEGIEDRVALEHLKAAGCAYGQGFLFARPLDHDALAELLEARARSLRPGDATDGVQSLGHPNSHAEG
ncbi:MAG: putative bifunctional diguanylate cyclase/phosphodiesterase [Solirubrobacteraceae bacterium]